MNSRTALRHAQSRIRNTRHSCYLTHGDDQHDHRGLNRARRAEAKAEIAVQLEEAELPHDADRILAEEREALELIVNCDPWEWMSDYDYDYRLYDDLMDAEVEMYNVL